MKSLFAFIFGLFIAIAAPAQSVKPPKETAMDRFLRYVKIDTQSAEDQTTVPSTKKQLNSPTCWKELKDLAQNVRASEFGTSAIVPGNRVITLKVPALVTLLTWTRAGGFWRKRKRGDTQNYQGAILCCPKIQHRS